MEKIVEVLEVESEKEKFKIFKSFLPPQKFFTPYVSGRVKNFHSENEYIDVETFFWIMNIQKVKTR